MLKAEIKETGDNSYAIEGELNMQTVPDVSRHLNQLLQHHEGNKLSFDLAEVSRSDSAGVALLVELMQIARKQKLELSFQHLPSQMQDIAKVSGLADILPISDN